MLLEAGLYLEEGLYYVVEDWVDPPPSTSCWAGLFLVVPARKAADVVELTDFSTMDRDEFEEYVEEGRLILKRVEKPDDIPSDDG